MWLNRLHSNWLSLTKSWPYGFRFDQYCITCIEFLQEKNALISNNAGLGSCTSNRCFVSCCRWLIVIRINILIIFIPLIGVLPKQYAGQHMIIKVTVRMTCMLIAYSTKKQHLIWLPASDSWFHRWNTGNFWFLNNSFMPLLRLLKFQWREEFNLADSLISNIISK